MEGSHVSYTLRSRRPVHVVHAARGKTEPACSTEHEKKKATQPLKRQEGMKRGNCSDIPRTPAKKEKHKTPQTKRSSAVKQKKVRVQCNDSDTPTSVVIKTNPLFNNQSSPPLTSGEKQETAAVAGIENFGEVDFAGYHKIYCDPTRRGQRQYTRKTKDYEMISAIMELAKYGEKRYGQKKSKSLFSRAKSLGKRKSSSDMKSPTRSDRHPRSPLRSKELQKNLSDFYP